MKRIKRGDIFYANLDPVIGCEQSGTRPVLILQNDKENKYSPTTLIAPISTKKEKSLPTHILIKHFNNILKDSIILLEQIKVVDKKRLKKYICKLHDLDMKKVEKAIMISLGIK